MEFKKVEDDIKPILKNNISSRIDDMTLYACYSYEKIAGLNLGAGWLEKIFSDKRLRISYGIAPYETVSRIRRKLQEKHEELRPTPEQRAEKRKLEQRYKQYAREGVYNE